MYFNITCCASVFLHYSVYLVLETELLRVPVHSSKIQRQLWCNKLL